MARPKKEKYIRDLFEENFSEKFYALITKMDKSMLIENFFNSRKEVYRALSKHLYFQDIPITAFNILKEDEVFDINKYCSFLFRIEFRGLLYEQYKFNENISKYKWNTILGDLIKDKIRKSFNKSIDNFIKKHENEFYIFPISRSSIVINVLLNIFYDINNILKKYIEPNFKKERVDLIVENRNTFLASEYEYITKIYQNYKNVKKLSEEDIRYYISNKLKYDPFDEGINYVIQNYNDEISKKDFAIKYLREKYNVSNNIETIDKILDRGRKKRKMHIENIMAMTDIDMYLIKINANKLEIVTPKEIEFNSHDFIIKLTKLKNEKI